MKCLNYECILSVMLSLLNYLHVANKNKCGKKKGNVFPQMKNNNPFQSILAQTVEVFLCFLLNFD